jgi:ribosome-associated toxin RatA of RatAB toxin-antitoxin module
MYASASGFSSRPHFSQADFISNAIVTLAAVARPSPQFSLKRGSAKPFPMHTGNSIIIQAPKMTVFETAANLELWPKILPHYRYIRYIERGADRNLVVMAARRFGLPISWTSEQIIDRARCEIHFHHLKAWTKGMRVVWSFRETPAGVVVEIVHDLRFRVRLLAPLIEPIIGRGFIHPVASKTLHFMKIYLEKNHAAK